MRGGNTQAKARLGFDPERRVGVGAARRRHCYTIGGLHPSHARSGGFDNTLKLGEVATGRELRTFTVFELCPFSRVLARWMQRAVRQRRRNLPLRLDGAVSAGQRAPDARSCCSQLWLSSPAVSSPQQKSIYASRGAMLPWFRSGSLSCLFGRYATQTEFRDLVIGRVTRDPNIWRKGSDNVADRARYRCSSLPSFTALPLSRFHSHRKRSLAKPVSRSLAVRSAEAKFNTAVAMLHSFHYPRTVREDVTAIASQEPSCAMAYWGIAISQRPNPLVGPFSQDLLRQGWDAIQRARKASQKNDRESAWIEAMAAFYEGYEKVDQRTRTARYETAMSRCTPRILMTSKPPSSMRWP